MAWAFCSNCQTSRKVQPWRSNSQTVVNGCPRCVPGRLDRYSPPIKTKSTAERIRELKELNRNRAMLKEPTCGPTEGDGGSSAGS